MDAVQVIEKVLMETDDIFPANWKEMIRGKKVIFYNTGVTGMLNGREKRIEKMKWVFKFFQKRPEAVLWWRPHPLELSTIQSMLPELEKQYRELMRQYKEENIGILDESADLKRAIAVSDAYYGDWSSVAELFKAVKKPVLYVNDMVKEIRDALYLPGTVCVKDEFFWFIQLNSNKLVKVNRSTYETVDIISIPTENPYKHRMYNYHIIDIGSSLLLLLEKSKNIYEYDIASGKFTAYPLKPEDKRFHSEIVIEHDGKWFMFPYNDSGILEYDRHLGNVDFKLCTESQKIKAAKCCVYIGTKIYMVSSGTNRVFQYDFVNHTCTFRDVGDQNNKYWGIKKADKYWVLPQLDKKAVTLWDEEKDEITELRNFPDHYMCLSGNAYLDMYEKDGNVYLFPFYANMILKIDTANKMIGQEYADIFSDAGYGMNPEYSGEAMFLCAKRYGDCIYTYALYKKCWQIFDLETMSVENSPLFEIDRQEYREKIECILDNEEYEESFCEGESVLICNLNNYVKGVQKDFHIGNAKATDKESVGVCIYGILMGKDEK